MYTFFCAPCFKFCLLLFPPLETIKKKSEKSYESCATILSRRGGLPETIPYGVYLNRINQKEIYKKIQELILNKKFRKSLQVKSLNHVFHDIKKNTKIFARRCA